MCTPGRSTLNKNIEASDHFLRRRNSHFCSVQYLHLLNLIAITVYILYPYLFKVPQVKGKVLWYECGTPISDANFLQSYKGGSYGTRCNLEFTNRENSRWIMRPDTEITNLYMAGQDAWTPAVAGAMYGGLLGAMKVIVLAA